MKQLQEGIAENFSNKQAERQTQDSRKIFDMGLVQKRLAEINEIRVKGAIQQGPCPIVTIGVCFRTDQMGGAHSYDLAGVKAVNNTMPALPFTVAAVSLPSGAGGADTPIRNAQFSDLDGIDLLYIPGAPVAADSQIATTFDASNIPDREELDLQRAAIPINHAKGAAAPSKNYLREKRKFDEHTSRAKYELALIDIARNRGIPILAICAGSWRLLEGYGGQVRTLRIGAGQRDKHKAPGQDVWGTSHSVDLSRGTMLRSLHGGAPNGRLETVNSTHWAVACARHAENELVMNPNAAINTNRADPHRFLEIAAWADDPVEATVEAFESRQGAPAMGIQWHPETYLPGMKGAGSGSPEGRRHASELFRFMAYAAWTSKRRPGQVAMVTMAENEAFKFCTNAAKAAARCAFGECNNLLEQATRQIRRNAWSPRMLTASHAIDLLKEREDFIAKSKLFMVAYNLREARKLLLGIGIVI
ncbi:anthranilate/para-aminobenzoate synthase component II [Oxalobacteraceae bacterium GrIS 1.11]